MRALWTLAAGLTALAALPVLAHHSIDAEFDRNKPITISGTVTKVDWMNPHIWIYLDVKDKDGKTVKWQFEGGPPNALRRGGWNRDSVKEGDQITVKGIMAKVSISAGLGVIGCFVLRNKISGGCFCVVSPEWIRNAGVQIIEVNKASFQAVMTPVYDKFMTSPEMKRMVKAIQDTK